MGEQIGSVKRAWERAVLKAHGHRPGYVVKQVGEKAVNAFSKKVENHAADIALYFMYYNFGRIHQTLRVTPAMEAGVANHVWSVEEIVALLG